MLKKFLWLTAFVAVVSGSSAQLRADCVIGRLFDGGASVTCGVILVGTGLVVMIPGMTSQIAANRTGSTFLGLCAGISYLSGLSLIVGGVKIALEGVAQFFGLRKERKRIDHNIRKKVRIEVVSLR